MDSNRLKLDKKSLLIGIIFAALFVLWPSIMNVLWPPPPRPPAPPPQARATNQIEQVAPAVTQTSAPPTVVKPVEATPPAVAKPELPRPAEQRITLTNEFVEVEFATYGGGISKITLQKYREDVDDPDLVVLNRYAVVPMGQVTGIDGFDTNTVYSMRSHESSVVFEAVNDAGLKLTKEYRLGADYLLEGTFTVANQGPKSLGQARLQIAMGAAAAVVPTDTFDMPYLGWGDRGKSHFVDPGHFDSNWFTRRPVRTLIREDSVRMTWNGMDDRFFCTLWMPQANTGSLSVTRRVVEHPGHKLNPQKPRPNDYALDGVLISPAFTLAAGQNYEYAFKLYAGPKEYRRIKALGQGQTAVMHWGWFEWMGELLLASLNLIHKVVPNYFWVIILLTAIIKVILWPLQAVSNRNMKAMQALAPKITALREKYKEDPQKMNAEVMKLYRENKVNPAMGCLPMLMQFPVFIGLYYMLRSAIELRGHGFLWIHDLAQPDTVAYLAGFAINPLPLVMCGTMIWQMKMTPTGAADPMQQKMMMFMPLLFLFFFYGTPSGLVLYWTVQNLFSIAQMAMTKHASTPVGQALPATVAPPKPQPRTKVKSK